MLQRLLTALSQQAAANVSKNLLNKSHQIMYFFYQTKEIINKLYNNIDTII